MEYGNVEELNELLGQLNKNIIGETINNSMFDFFPEKPKKGTRYYSCFFFKNVELTTGDKLCAFYKILTEVKSKDTIRIIETETSFYEEINDVVLDMLNQYDEVIYFEISENYKALYEIIKQGFKVPVWVFDSIDGSEPDYYSSEIYIPLDIIKEKYIVSIVGDSNNSTDEDSENLKEFIEDCKSKKLRWISMEDDFKNLLNAMKQI